MNGIDFVALTFAAFYLAYALVHLDLPFNIMKRFRETVTTIGGLLLCFYCAAWWVALGLYLVQYRALDLVWASAIAGAASFAYRYTGGPHG